MEDVTLAINYTLQISMRKLLLLPDNDDDRGVGKRVTIKHQHQGL